MKKLLNLSIFYAILGTLSAVFYLVFPKIHHYEGTSLLDSLFLFLFLLGTLVHLLLIVFEKLFNIHQHSLYGLFLKVYNTGLFASALIMLSKGILTVIGAEKSSLLAALTGVGHLFTTVGGVLLFIILKSKVTDR